MADIHIRRNHHLGLTGARKVAWQWAEQAEEQFDMSCTYEESDTCDEVQFTRSGVSGMSICVTPYSDSASSAALTITTRLPAQPASPQPLVPSGLVVAGTGQFQEPSSEV